MTQYTEDEITKNGWGTCWTHCCAQHGCKYCDDNCPVFTGLIKQAYDCEDCAWDKEAKKETAMEILQSVESLDQFLEMLYSFSTHPRMSYALNHAREALKNA